MNFFAVLKQGDKLELVTAPLSRGDILPGVTRDSLLTLAKGYEGVTVSERSLTMGELCQAESEGRFVEAFGAGTAAIVQPIKAIRYQDRDVCPSEGREDAGSLCTRLWRDLLDIQYGRVESAWSVPF
jgi:branched-chain amino acid aminotransferase